MRCRELRYAESTISAYALPRLVVCLAHVVSCNFSPEISNSPSEIVLSAAIASLIRRLNDLYCEPKFFKVDKRTGGASEEKFVEI